MAQLVSVLKVAAQLSASLFEHAEDVGFGDPERTAFRADALMVVSTTQALSVSPGQGYDSPAYDAVLAQVREAMASTVSAEPDDAGSIHRARLDAVQAAEAMRSVTARPAVAVS